MNDEHAGFIFENPLPTIYLGNNALPVKAIPQYGYVFIEWSDGIQTPTRADTNIQGSALIVAHFEKMLLPLSIKLSIKPAQALILKAQPLKAFYIKKRLKPLLLSPQKAICLSAGLIA